MWCQHTADSLVKRVVDIDCKDVTFGKLNWSVLEFANTNFRSLQVNQHPDVPAMSVGAFARDFGALHMVFRRVVGKVQAYNIHTGLDQLIQHLGVICRGPRVATIFVLRSNLIP